MSKGSSACVVGLACGRMTLRNSRTGQNLRFVYSLRSMYGGRLLLNNPRYIPHLAVSCQLGHGSSCSSRFLSTQSQSSSSRSSFLYGPSLQRGRQPERKVETIEETVESTSQEETKAVVNIEVPTKPVKVNSFSPLGYDKTEVFLCNNASFMLVEVMSRSSCYFMRQFSAPSFGLSEE